MPALLSVLSWLIFLFGFASAVDAYHPAGDQDDDAHQKKIEIRVEVRGDDVHVEALEDGKKVDLEKLGDGLHTLLKHIPAAKLDAEVEAMVVRGDGDDGASAKQIKKIIRVSPHHGHQNSEVDHQSANQDEVLKSILSLLPEDAKAQLKFRKVVRMSDNDEQDEDEEHEEAEAHSQHHAQAHNNVKVLVNRLDEDEDEDEGDHDAKQKTVIIQLEKDGEGPNVSWLSRDANQMIFSPDGKTNMVFLGSQPAGKFKLGVALTPIGDLIRNQLQIDDDAGIAVESVMDDSPAAKAGLRRYDIIVKADDSEVRELSDLVAAIEKAGRSKSVVQLSILRGGERRTIAVTPEPNEGRSELKRQLDWKQKSAEEPEDEEDEDVDSLRDLKKQLQELRAIVEELRKK